MATSAPLIEFSSCWFALHVWTCLQVKHVTQFLFIHFSSYLSTYLSTSLLLVQCFWGTLTDTNCFKLFAWWCNWLIIRLEGEGEHHLWNDTIFFLKKLKLSSWCTSKAGAAYSHLFKLGLVWCEIGMFRISGIYWWSNPKSGPECKCQKLLAIS